VGGRYPQIVNVYGRDKQRKKEKFEGDEGGESIAVFLALKKRGRLDTDEKKKLSASTSVQEKEAASRQGVNANLALPL